MSKLNAIRELTVWALMQNPDGPTRSKAEAIARFDEIMSAHDREVAAAALDEAADDIRRNGCLHVDDLRVASEHLLFLAAQKRGA